MVQLLESNIKIEMSANPEKEHKLERTDKICLTYINGTGYTFDVDDYINIRSRYHMTGATVGTVTGKGCDPEETGMPVHFSHHETRLLVEQGIAVLVCKREFLLKKPTESDLEEYQKDLEKRVNKQVEILKAKKVKEIEQHLDQIVAGRKKKLIKQGVPINEINIDPAELLKEISDKYVIDKEKIALPISLAHNRPHWGRVLRPLPDKSLKYCVFRDLWMRGKFVNSGENFGADFAVYPGDPGIFHASHIVILLQRPYINPLHLIGKVRVSVIVNKMCVLAYFDKTKEDEVDKDSFPKVAYQTVTWYNNVEKHKNDTAAKKSPKPSGSDCDESD